MRKFLLHLLFWVIFFLMWNRIMYFYISNPMNRLYFSALDVSMIILAFYVIYLYVMPYYFSRKNIWALLLPAVLLLLLLSVVFSLLMLVFLRRKLVPISFSFYWNYTDLQYNRFFIALVGILAGCFVKLAIDRMEAARKMESLEREKSLAELNYLKAQINPHFLFNSLNSLYTQLEVGSAEAKTTLSSLADLLRFQLYECNVAFIPIANELTYLRNYFSLQSIRKDNCRMELLLEEPPGDLLIAPLLLIPFVENAFKYVSDHDDHENFIRVTAGFTGHGLVFNCVNTIEKMAPELNGNKGIGLVNVKKRLDLIYGDKYQLQTGAVHERYEVKLTLELK